ncbi:MAG: TonB-dependent receptor [Opitutaceae bacterium]|nr:TonB-dependent receptor [Opitutaceae bacterium]
MSNSLNRIRSHRSRLFQFFAFLTLVVPLAAAVTLDIPALPASDSLQALAKQADVEVLFSHADLAKVQTKALRGSFEPLAALETLLDGTGYTVRQTAVRNFVVVARETASVVRGELSGNDGRPAEGVSVRVEETSLSTVTDKNGIYTLKGLPAGTYTLVAAAEGFQPLHITEVRVRAGRSLTLGRQRMRSVASTDDIAKLKPYFVQADSVTELDPFEVKDRTVKPYSDANVDIPRTVNDIQPYYIFDNRTIELSGATTVEDFLTKNLTMNVLRSTNSSNTTSYGTNSDVNLRGLGVDRTLVLVNGRRLPNTVMLTSTYQTDLNGISPSMIDRIEVLPTSASGIYGGNALGGVVNIILKRNFSGGEARANYSNTWDGDAARRSLSLNWAQALEGGKTQLMLAASYSDGNAMRLQDRGDLVKANYRRAYANNPDHVSTAANPFAGATTNITNSVAANLVLKNGTALSSRLTYVPPGLSPSATDAEVAAALQRNAGSINLEHSSFYWLQSGLGSFFGFTPTARSINAAVSRKMLPNLELFVDYAFSRNRGVSLYSGYFNSTRTVAANAPTNPFTTAVLVKMPAEYLRPRIGIFDKNTLTAGAKITLPKEWIAQLDYTWVTDDNEHSYEVPDNTAVNNAISSGVIDPFVDTQLFPVSLAPYATRSVLTHGASQDSLSARASGPLPRLPWGAPTLTVGLENRMVGTTDGTSESFTLATNSSSSRTYYLGMKQIVSSAYSELQFPLVERNRLPLVHVLEAQLAGRMERVEQSSGTSTATLNTVTGVTTYSQPTVAGAPFRRRVRYEATSPTFGLKYQPIPSVTFRGSYSKGFQPPTAAQLVRNPEPSTTTTQVLDPVSNTTYGVLTVSGGNAEIKPQTSRSLNLGVIFEPKTEALRGLRFNAEYYEIEQFDAISTLSAQLIANLFPERVTRDASRQITLIDTSSMNLYGRDMSGWDFNVSYRLPTRSAGAFNFSGTQSLILRSRTQFSLTLPAYDGVNFPTDTSIGGALRQQTNLNLNWELGKWGAGWTSRLLSSYKAYGSAGGPLSLQSASGANFSTYAAAQGNNGTIPSQDTHDVVVSYRFGQTHPETKSGLTRVGARVTDGMTVTMGVRNVFNSEPEFDVGPFGLGYFSPFVDIRMREYWISVRRAF